MDGWIPNLTPTRMLKNHCWEEATTLMKGDYSLCLEYKILSRNVILKKFEEVNELAQEYKNTFGESY